MPAGTPVPWSYYLIRSANAYHLVSSRANLGELPRLLFKFVLKIFYGTIVIENTEFIPRDGEPCIVCANHSNSLTDALLLVTSIPPKIRRMLRLTAKATQFGHPTFTSWLIESAGTVPIQRRKDYPDGTTDNSAVMTKLMEALEHGDAVCLFPEGMSRYHPTIAPLKTGVARLVSDVLTRNRDKPDFSISILNCSVTYMFTPKTHPELLAPVNYDDIRAITTEIHDQISSGTIDSPSWKLVRASKLAARMYAPLGTRMRLGDYVRVTLAFLEAFKNVSRDHAEGEDHVNDEELIKLNADLDAYQDRLVQFGVKDDRVMRPLSRRTIVSRILIRLTWSIALFALSFPGLLLWLPVFAVTFYAVHNFKKTGPIFDTWDEIAQYKLIYGLASGLCVWIVSILLTLPFAAFTTFLVPALMWMTLRWLEDAISAFRAFNALRKLLLVNRKTLKEASEQRKDLHSRVMDLASKLGLPDNPETYFLRSGGKEKGRVRGKWESSTRYFSVKRRRKRDWNETLRLYDKVDYPDDDS
ncbi:hypothetical protein ONZ45_g17048 [Pleurotus djamor]|nr:hypothetical protein ONZ45_g17048 [Pleurotus djamor]